MDSFYADDSQGESTLEYRLSMGRDTARYSVLDEEFHDMIIMAIFDDEFRSLHGAD